MLAHRELYGNTAALNKLLAKQRQDRRDRIEAFIAAQNTAASSSQLEPPEDFFGVLTLEALQFTEEDRESVTSELSDSPQATLPSPEFGTPSSAPFVLPNLESPGFQLGHDSDGSDSNDSPSPSPVTPVLVPTSLTF